MNSQTPTWVTILVAILVPLASGLAAYLALRASREAAAAAVEAAEVSADAAQQSATTSAEAANEAARVASGSSAFSVTAADNARFQMHKRKVYGELISAIELHEVGRTPETQASMLGALAHAQMAAAPPLRSDLMALRETLKAGQPFERELARQIITSLAMDAEENR